jgi:hypothetical protein
MYNKTMARPRKYEKRMSRSLGLRLPDDQYDWLMERTAEFEGDLSEATRDAIDAARILYGLFSATDPHAELQKLLDDSERQGIREAYFDEFGEYPDE